MSNTYTQLYVQMVFAVKYREALIIEPIRNRIEKYITGMVNNRGHKMIQIYCMPDHCHLFIGQSPEQSIADLMRDVKSKSTDFINDNRLCTNKFQWQGGYGAFSYSKNDIDRVAKYILNQPIHHLKKSFRQEYAELLIEHDVEYDERYLFEYFE